MSEPSPWWHDTAVAAAASERVLPIIRRWASPSTYLMARSMLDELWRIARTNDIRPADTNLIDRVDAAPESRVDDWYDLAHQAMLALQILSFAGATLGTAHE